MCVPLMRVRQRKITEIIHKYTNFMISSYEKDKQSGHMRRNDEAVDIKILINKIFLMTSECAY